MPNRQHPRTVAAVLLAATMVVASAGVAFGAPSTAREASCVTGASGVTVTDGQTQDGRIQDYEVTFTDIQIDTWRLIDVTVTGATIREVHVTNVTTANGTADNVTLENVSLSEFHVANATLSNVTADELVVRNRSVIDVPGADLLGNGISNRTIDRHVLKAITIDGLVIDRMNVSSLDAVDGALDGVSQDESSPDPSPVERGGADVVIANSTVDAATVENATGADWVVENTSADNQSLDADRESRARGPSPTSC